MPRPATALLPELYTLEEVEGLTGISVRNLRYALRTKAAGGWLVDRRWHMSREQLDAYLRSIRQEAKAPASPTHRIPASRTAEARARVAARLAA
jgi:hypothetical protein